jgi:hypothetical protein
LLLYARRGYNRFMNERKDVFQDEFTENQSKPPGPQRDSVEQTTKLDPDVDSQEADENVRE